MKNAEIAYKKAIEVDPTHLNALRNLGMLYRMQQRDEDAREMFKRASLLPDAKKAGNEDILQNLEYLNKKLAKPEKSQNKDDVLEDAYK